MGCHGSRRQRQEGAAWNAGAANRLASITLSRVRRALTPGQAYYV